MCSGFNSEKARYGRSAFIIFFFIYIEIAFPLYFPSFSSIFDNILITIKCLGSGPKHR